MVVMRCISVLTFRQDERSCSNSIEQQRLPVSTFARWFALTFSIILSCSCVIPCFFRKSRIRPPNSFASNRIVQSFPLRRKRKQAETPFPSPGLFSAWKCTMTATRWSCSCEQLTEYYQPLINSFQKHQYVLVCSATISNFLRFSQVSFSRFHAKNWTLSAFNKRI